MKKVMISLFALLLMAAQAQAQKEPLAVLVVGVDSWMFGDVIAHIVGEELKRGNPNLIPVTREKFVQNKLKALRRATGWINYCELRDWANAEGLSQLCLVEAASGHSFTSATQTYSAQLIDVAACQLSCSDEFTFEHSGAPGEMSAAELTKVAWEIVGRLQSSSCRPSDVKCYSWEPTVVLVEHGTFTMGCVENRDGPCIYHNDELPNHPVELTKDFRIGVTEITQGEWKAVMGSLPQFITDEYLGDKKPVISVSWNDIAGPGGYLEKLNAALGLTDAAHQYRLPTEAEWEYAARGGHHKENFKYSGSDDEDEVAWHSGNTKTLQVVKGKKANALGVYDMSGNVAEWCMDSDKTTNGYLSSALQTDPVETSGRGRMIRGGNYIGSNGRVASRSSTLPVNANHGRGFRVVLP
jgi:formylglycine-generating enzyme required for sulfatase activity